MRDPDDIDGPADLDPEDAGETSPRKSPWDPRKLRVSAKPWSLRQALDDVNAGTIDLTPELERPSVWTPARRSRLVESVLVGIPLPAFYFNADASGRIQVVDGVQRLSAIRDFVAGSFALQDLEYLADLNGKRWSDLEPAYRRRFHQTQIFVNVVEPETPAEVKFNVFQRISVGGDPLSPQEIRHALGRERSRELLRRMVASPAFALATGGAFERDRRMRDRELALRFVALRLDPDLKAYEQAESVDDYLVACTARLDDPAAVGDAELADLERGWERAMTTAHALFGAHAFRRPAGAGDRPHPLNRALFESWSVVLADAEPGDVLPRQAAIVAAVREAFDVDKDFVSSFTAGTWQPSRVRLRLEVARKITSEAGKG